MATENDMLHKRTATNRHSIAGALALLMATCAGMPVLASTITAKSPGTRVTTSGNGQAVIGLATPQSGVSYNAFSQFNVDAAGAVFANRGSNARTIVAEVFSAAPARLAGPLSVDGPRANLIFASQNGISVDGGSFVNFGSVALTTGALSLKDQTLASGVTVRDIKADTSAGGIEIGPGGLSADLIRLELIAKTLVINGPITNSYTSPTAVTRMVAGDSSAVFDTLASPTDNLTPWAYYTAGTSSSPAIAVDVASGSKITSGRIEILITDQGAGVRNAGEFLASAGDFRLNGSGALEQIGGRIQAAGNVAIQARSFHQESQGTQASQVVAGVSLKLSTTGDIDNQSGILSGVSRDANDGASTAAVSLAAGGRIANRSDVGGKMAIVFGSNDDIRIDAGGDFVNDNARVVGNKDLFLVAGGTVRNESEHVGGMVQSWADSNWYRRQSGYTVDQGALADPANTAYLVADGNVTIQARTIANRGGTINATQGDLHLTAADTLNNSAWAIGQFRYQSDCLLFFCKRSAQSDERLVGGQLNAGHDVILTAGQAIDNTGGLIYAVNDMTLDAPTVTANGSPVHAVLTRATGLKAFFGDTWAAVYATDQGGGFTAQQGRLVLTGKGVQDRGYFSAAQGVAGTIEVISPPLRDAVDIGEHLGITTWFWR